MATVNLSGERTVSMTSIIPVIKGLRDHLADQMPKTVIEKALLKNTSNVNDQRLYQYEKNHLFQTATTTLDPRYKTHALPDETMQVKVNQAIISKCSAIRRTNPPVVPVAPPVSENTDPNASFWRAVDQKYKQLTTSIPECNLIQATINAFNREATISRFDCPLIYWEKTAPAHCTR